MTAAYNYNNGSKWTETNSPDGSVFIVRAVHLSASKKADRDIIVYDTTESYMNGINTYTITRGAADERWTMYQPEWQENASYVNKPEYRSTFDARAWEVAHVFENGEAVLICELGRESRQVGKNEMHKYDKV